MGQAALKILRRANLAWRREAAARVLSRGGLIAAAVVLFLFLASGLAWSAPPLWLGLTLLALPLLLAALAATLRPARRDVLLRAGQWLGRPELLFSLEGAAASAPRYRQLLQQQVDRRAADWLGQKPPRLRVGRPLALALLAYLPALLCCIALSSAGDPAPTTTSERADQARQSALRAAVAELGPVPESSRARLAALRDLVRAGDLSARGAERAEELLVELRQAAQAERDLAQALAQLLAEAGAPITPGDRADQLRAAADRIAAGKGDLDAQTIAKLAQAARQAGDRPTADLLERHGAGGPGAASAALAQRLRTLASQLSGREATTDARLAMRGEGAGTTVPPNPDPAGGAGLGTRIPSPRAPLSAEDLDAGASWAQASTARERSILARYFASLK